MGFHFQIQVRGIYSYFECSKLECSWPRGSRISIFRLKTRKTQLAIPHFSRFQSECESGKIMNLQSTWPYFDCQFEMYHIFSLKWTFFDTNLPRGQDLTWWPYTFDKTLANFSTRTGRKWIQIYLALYHLRYNPFEYSQ